MLHYYFFFRFVINYFQVCYWSKFLKLYEKSDVWQYLLYYVHHYDESNDFFLHLMFRNLFPGSFSFSVLSGKVMFRDVHLITEDYSLRVHLGLGIFRWWRPLIQKDINEGKCHRQDTRHTCKLLRTSSILMLGRNSGWYIQNELEFPGTTFSSLRPSDAILGDRYGWSFGLGISLVAVWPQGITWTNYDLLSIGPLAVSFQRNFYQNMKIFTQENASENVICKIPAYHIYIPNRGVTCTT